MRNILASLMLAPCIALAEITAVDVPGGTSAAPAGKAVAWTAASTNASASITLTHVRSVPLWRKETSFSSNSVWNVTAWTTNSVVDWRGTNYTYTASASNQVWSVVTNTAVVAAGFRVATNTVAAITCSGGFASGTLETPVYIADGELAVTGDTAGSRVILILER